MKSETRRTSGSTFARVRASVGGERMSFEHRHIHKTKLRKKDKWTGSGKTVYPCPPPDRVCASAARTTTTAMTLTCWTDLMCYCADFPSNSCVHKTRVLPEIRIFIQFEKFAKFVQQRSQGQTAPEYSRLAMETPIGRHLDGCIRSLTERFSGHPQPTHNHHARPI